MLWWRNISVEWLFSDKDINSNRESEIIMAEDETPFDIDYIDELDGLQGCDEAEGALETRDVTIIIVRWVIIDNWSKDGTSTMFVV